MNDLNNDINMSNDNNVNNKTDDTIKKIAVNLINIHEYNDENKDINNNSSSNSNHNNDKSSISLEKNTSFRKLPSFIQQSPRSIHKTDNRSDSPFRNEDNKIGIVKFMEQKSFGKPKFI